MNLSERLERARRERLRAAGLLDDSDEPAAAPAPPPPPARRADWTFDPIVIEALPPVGPRPVADRMAGPRPPGPAADPTTPTHCPNCNHEAVADLVDLVGHRTHYSCPNCYAMWQVVADAGKADPPRR